MEPQALDTTLANPHIGLHASKWAPKSTSRPETSVSGGSVISRTELLRTPPGCIAITANTTDTTEDISQIPIAPLSASSELSTLSPNIPSASATDPRDTRALLREHPSQNPGEHFLESIYRLRDEKRNRSQCGMRRHNLITRQPESGHRNPPGLTMEEFVTRLRSGLHRYMPNTTIQQAQRDEVHLLAITFELTATEEPAFDRISSEVKEMERLCKDYSWHFDWARIPCEGTHNLGREFWLRKKLLDFAEKVGPDNQGIIWYNGDAGRAHVPTVSCRGLPPHGHTPDTPPIVWRHNTWKFGDDGKLKRDGRGVSSHRPVLSASSCYECNFATAQSYLSRVPDVDIIWWIDAYDSELSASGSTSSIIAAGDILCSSGHVQDPYISTKPRLLEWYRSNLGRLLFNGDTLSLAIIRHLDDAARSQQWLTPTMLYQKLFNEVLRENSDVQTPDRERHEIMPLHAVRTADLTPTVALLPCKKIAGRYQIENPSMTFRDFQSGYPRVNSTALLSILITDCATTSCFKAFLEKSNCEHPEEPLKLALEILSVHQAGPCSVVVILKLDIAFWRYLQPDSPMKWLGWSTPVSGRLFQD